MDFTEANTLLEGGRTASSRERRKLENNTWLERRDGAIAVRLHNTDVVTYYADGTAMLNTGGWFTVTTKDRINGWAPVRIGSVKGEWFLTPSGGDRPQYPRYDRENTDAYFAALEVYNVADRAWHKANRQPFFDGIRVDGKGNVVNPAPADDMAAKRIEREATKKEIARYVKGFAAALAQGMDAPSGGDCWYCAMRTTDGEGMGDAFGDTDHLRSHMAEGYYVPSMLVAAVTEAGYRMPGFILGAREDGGIGGGREIGDAAKRSLSKYLKRRLVEGAATRG